MALGAAERENRFWAIGETLSGDLEGLEALTKGGFGKEEFKAAWFRGKWYEPSLDGYESNYRISGSFRGVPVRIAEVYAWSEREDSDGDRGRQTIFKGSVVHLRGVLDRKLRRDLRVLPAGAVRQAASRFGLGGGGVDLEDPEWRQRHRVLGDQVEARLVFTPERMREFMGIYDSKPWRVSLLFRGTDVYVFWKERYLDMDRPEAAVELLRKLVGLPWALGLTSRPPVPRSGDWVRVEIEDGCRWVRREEAEAARKAA